MTAVADNPSLTIGIAFLAGVICLVLARHVRLPSIVLLLGAGVVLGPDVLGIVHPASLGSALAELVEFGVAVILFEGGLNLELRRLRREARVIRQLVSVGALVTAAGGACAAHWIMGWDWTLSILFGTLVIVTGPTVMAPLLRRIKVKRNVATVLEAEGVLIDPIGAVIALVTLELLSAPADTTLGVGALGVFSRLGFGLVVGLASGFLIGGLLRTRHAIPEGLENILTLGVVFGTFQISEVFLPESGIMAVTVAGFVVGNMRTHVHRDLKEFKEQLTLLLISLLFVLLAADVRLAGVMALGWPGLATVLALMFIVRPLNVLVSTIGVSMPWNERGFLAWLAPRGIIAAAVASHFAHVLNVHGSGSGDELLALVFMVIAVTVVVQGLTGGFVASLLGVRLPRPSGVCILGANPIGRTMARLLGATGVETVLIDISSQFASEAEAAGLRVVFGNGLEERTLLRARIDTMAMCVSLTANSAANRLFAQHAIEDFGIRDAYVALKSGYEGVNEKQITELGARVLFGKPQEIERWSVRLERGLAVVELWEWDMATVTEASATDIGESSDERESPESPAELPPHVDFPKSLLPLLRYQKGAAKPFAAGTEIKLGDRLHLARHVETNDALTWLEENGWSRVVDEAVDEAEAEAVGEAEVGGADPATPSAASAAVPNPGPTLPG